MTALPTTETRPAARAADHATAVHPQEDNR